MNSIFTRIIPALLLPSLATAQGEPIDPFATTDAYLSLNLLHKEPMAFVPLTLREISDPAGAEVLAPDDLVYYEHNGRGEVYVAQDLVDLLNSWEQKLNRMGQSLRSAEPTLLVTNLPNPDIWGRTLRSRADLALDQLAKNIQAPLPKCPKLTPETLGLNMQAKVPFLDRPAIKVADLMPRLNQQQEFFCRLGVSLLSELSSPDLSAVLKRRDVLMEQLGIRSDHPLFTLASWATPRTLAEMHERIDEIKTTLEKPSPEKLYALSQKYRDKLPPALQLPEIPSIPAPQVKRRTELKLQKRYEWQGFDEGDRNYAAIYANAWAELRAGRLEDPESVPTSDHALQAEAKGGMYLINNQINILGATLDSAFNPTDAYARLTTCFLGTCFERKTGKEGIGVAVGDPNAFQKSWKNEYKQQLVVGVVPVVLTVGGGVATNVGWRAGLNLLGVHAGADVNVKGSAIGEAAVGIADFVEAGAGGQIMVIDNTTAIGGQAELKFYGNGHPVIEGSLVGDNDLHAFDGRLYIYALLDVLGPLGPYVDQIIESIKDLPGAKELLAQTDKLSEFGQKVWNKLTDGGKNLVDGIAGAGPKAVNWARKTFGFHYRSPNGQPYGLSITGTKIRYEHDWLTWRGIHERHRFLNYKIHVGPDGQQYEGDMTAANPEALKILDGNLTIIQKEAELTSLKKQAQQREVEFFEHAAEFLQTSSSQAASALPRELAGFQKAQNEAVQQIVRQIMQGS